jgi:hypothetical protein
MAEYVIMLNNRLVTYNNYDEIPERFDHVIKFSPDIIPGPHTEEEHQKMDSWNSKLQALMKRELK